MASYVGVVGGCGGEEGGREGEGMKNRGKWDVHVCSFKIQEKTG